jgi:toxin ParE1/3/4
MYSYRLSLEAKEDIKRIYLYGYEEFGEALADEYYQSLFNAFDKIAENPLHYQSVDHIRLGYRRYVVGGDSIFFRVNNQFVEIMAIIGGQDTDIWI